MKTLKPGIKCMKHEIKICNDQKADGWIGKLLLEMHSLIECNGLQFYIL